MAHSPLSFDDLIFIAKRTGVENWVDPATGKRGAVIAAPSSHRGKKGEMGTVKGLTRHHTGTAETFKPTEDYPTYQVVKEGRPGLVNSLSAYGLGRWFGIYVFSEFLSWHAGEWLFGGITDGNGHFCGVEAEGTGARWTEFQQEFYPRLCASFLLFINEGVDWMPRHADGAMPRGRKNDAANLAPDFVKRVQKFIDHPDQLTYGGSVAPIVQEDTNMTVIEPGGEAVIIKGVGHKRLRVACDHDWQNIRLAINWSGGFWGWPGTTDYKLPVAKGKVSYLDLKDENDFISVTHLGPVEKDGKPRPVTVDTCP